MSIFLKCYMKYIIRFHQKLLNTQICANLIFLARKVLNEEMEESASHHNLLCDECKPKTMKMIYKYCSGF